MIPKVRPVILDDKTIAKILSQKKDDVNEVDDQIDDQIVEEDSINGNETESEMEEQSNWVITAVIAVVVNLILGVGGFFLYKKLKKRAAEQQSKLIERLET